MNARNWRLAVGGTLIATCGLGGCRPSTPIVAPPPTQSTANATAPSQPESTPTAVAVRPQPKPAAIAPPSTPVDPGLRDLAARLIEPNKAGGWQLSHATVLELERLGPEAPAKLLPLMNDAKVEVRRGATFHLHSSFDPNSREQVAAFTKALGDEDATIRGLGLQAAREMHAADISAATPQLIALLDPQTETKPQNRAALARFAGALAQQGMPFARALSKSAVNDPDERVRSAALFALTQIAKPDDYLPTLQKGLADKQPAVRLVAAGRMRTLGMPALPAAEALGKALSDEDERVRTAAAEALVRIGVLSLPVLSEQLGAKDVNARKLALACLSSLGPAAKVELAKIEKLLQDPDPDVREAAKVLVARLK